MFINKKAIYIFLTILLVVGAFVGGYFLKGCEYSNQLNVEGKIYVFDYIDLAWRDDITNEEKQELLEGHTEDEFRKNMAEAYKSWQYEFIENGEVNMSMIVSNRPYVVNLYYTQSVNNTFVQIWKDEVRSQLNTTLKFVNGKLCIDLLDFGDANGEAWANTMAEYFKTAYCVFKLV